LAVHNSSLAKDFLSRLFIRDPSAARSVGKFWFHRLWTSNLKDHPIRD